MSWPKNLSLLILCIALFLSACSPPKGDNLTAEIVGDLNTSTSKYFRSNIASYGSNACRYSASANQKFWSSTKGELRVIETRLNVIEANRESLAGFNSLKAAMESAEELAKTTDSNPDRLPGGQLSYCVDPVAATQQWVQISNALELLASDVAM